MGAKDVKRMSWLHLGPWKLACLPPCCFNANLMAPHTKGECQPNVKHAVALRADLKEVWLWQHWA